MQWNYLNAITLLLLLELLDFIHPYEKFCWCKKKSASSCQTREQREGETQKGWINLLGFIFCHITILLSFICHSISYQDSPINTATQTPVSQLLKKVDNIKTGSVLSIPKHHKKVSNFCTRGFSSILKLFNMFVYKL